VQLPNTQNKHAKSSHVTPRRRHFASLIATPMIQHCPASVERCFSNPQFAAPAKQFDSSARQSGFRSAAKQSNKLLVEK
jgi:hypothetical protein